ncbi:MAG: hypothetical protein GY870_10225, partial [archaeon]|nr:hypothetical protein [archaeon]
MDQFDKVMDFFRSISIPRYTGTPENEKVQNIIQSAFSEIKNVKIEVQQFNISHVFMNGLLCIMHPFIGLLMMLVFLLIFLESFTIAFILNIFLLIIATFNRQILDFLQFRVQNLGKQIPSSNIIATIDPDIKSEQTQTLVFLAHYDSISHVLFDVLESIGYLAALLGGVIFSIHSLIYLIPVILFNSSPDPMGQLIWGLLFALLTFIELFNSKGNKSQGVIDNGSGLAQIYHLALVLSENKLKNT